MILQGIYNSTPPTLTNHEYKELQLDVNGQLKVAGSFVVDSEFPAAAVLGDATVNPTTTSVAAHVEIFNGTTWDRMRGDTTGGAWAQGAVAHDAVDSGNPIKIGGKAADPTSMPTAVSVGDRVNAAFDTQGRLVIYDGMFRGGEYMSEGTAGVQATVPLPLASSTFASTKDVSSALEASKIVKASAGNLYRTFGVIDKSAATGMYYVLHLDSATLTADGAVTHLITPIPVNHTTGYDSSFDTGHFTFGTYATNGIVRVLSSTMVLKAITSAYMFATTSFK